jgi:hypothetical protein
MSVADLEILCAANVFVKRHGRHAAIVAAQRADECLAAGDVDGQTLWKRIVEAILELVKETPDELGRVN